MSTLSPTEPARPRWRMLAGEIAFWTAAGIGLLTMGAIGTAVAYLLTHGGPLR